MLFILEEVAQLVTCQLCYLQGLSTSLHDPEQVELWRKDVLRGPSNGNFRNSDMLTHSNYGNPPLLLPLKTTPQAACPSTSPFQPFDKPSHCPSSLFAATPRPYHHTILTHLPLAMVCEICAAPSGDRTAIVADRLANDFGFVDPSRANVGLDHVLAPN